VTQAAFAMEIDKRLELSPAFCCLDADVPDVGETFVLVSECYSTT